MSIKGKTEWNLRCKALNLAYFHIGKWFPLRKLAKFYQVMVVVHNDDEWRYKKLSELNDGDVLWINLGIEEVTVCGAVYDDGIDDMIPTVNSDGERCDYSPLFIR